MRSLSDENKPVTLWRCHQMWINHMVHCGSDRRSREKRQFIHCSSVERILNAQQMLRKEFRNREIRSKQNERTKCWEEKPCLRYRLTVCPPCTVCVQTEHRHLQLVVALTSGAQSTHTHSIRSHSRCKLQLCFVVISRFADSKLWHFGCLFIRPFFIHFIHSRWHWHIPCHSILLFCTFCSRRCCCCCCAVVGWCSAMIRRWLLCLSTRTWLFVLYFNLN